MKYVILLLIFIYFIKFLLIFFYLTICVLNDKYIYIYIYIYICVCIHKVVYNHICILIFASNY